MTTIRDDCRVPATIKYRKKHAIPPMRRQEFPAPKLNIGGTGLVGDGAYGECECSIAFTPVDQKHRSETEPRILVFVPWTLPATPLVYGRDNKVEVHRDIVPCPKLTEHGGRRRHAVI